MKRKHFLDFVHKVYNTLTSTITSWHRAVFQYTLLTTVLHFLICKIMMLSHKNSATLQQHENIKCCLASLCRYDHAI